jgi:UDP-glucose 4,6-dehydratase
MSSVQLINQDSASVVIFGGAGYIGSAFRKALDARGINYFAPESGMLNLLHHGSIETVLGAMKPTFIINCAGFTGKPNVDTCEQQQEETNAGNVTAPFNLAQTCDKLGIPWGHVSSGCIYNGYEKDFTEEDEPNFSFDNPPCSFYSGTKAQAEKVLKNMGCYIWRLRIPFDEFDSPRNYLSKILNYPTLLNAPNSISHRNDFVESCLELWANSADFGIYNVTNTGSIKASDVISLFETYHQKDFSDKRLIDGIEDFYDAVNCQALRSNCVLDNSKLLNAGVKIRSAEDALKEAIKKWTPK